MIRLEFREHFELFDKIESGLRVKFEFSFYGIIYKKGNVIPIELARVKRYDGTSYSVYKDPSVVEYTIRIDENGDIMLNGFWKK